MATIIFFLLSNLKAAPYIHDFQQIIGGTEGEKLVAWKYYVDILISFLWKRNTLNFKETHITFRNNNSSVFWTLVLQFY